MKDDVTNFDRAHFIGDLVCFLAEWEGWEDEDENWDWMGALAAHLAIGLLQSGSQIASLCDEIERLRTASPFIDDHQVCDQKLDAWKRGAKELATQRDEVLAERDAALAEIERLKAIA